MNIVGRKVSVKVPATSANLGPGFDTLGMALAFYDELEVEAVAESNVIVEVTGEGAGEVESSGHRHDPRVRLQRRALLHRDGIR